MCVLYHKEFDSDFKVREWHRHVVFYNDKNGYMQEYVYRNYLERMMMMRKVFRDESDEEDESHEERNSGLIFVFFKFQINIFFNIRYK